MIIQSRIHRANGTLVNLGKETYQFRSRPELTGNDTDQVCDVAFEPHAKRLLQITEGFQEYNAPDKTWNDVIEAVATPAPEELAQLAVRKIFAVIKKLADNELVALAIIEAGSSNRSSVLKAIATEQERRRNGKSA